MTGSTCYLSGGCCKGTRKEKEPAQTDNNLCHDPTQDLTARGISWPAPPIITTEASNSLHEPANQDNITSTHRHHHCACTKTAPNPIEQKEIEIFSVADSAHFYPSRIRSFGPTTMLCCGVPTCYKSQEASGSVESHSGGGSKNSSDTSRTQTDNQDGEVPHTERIVLTIEGLKCGCCETGISKAVRRVSAVRNPQINIVLAKIEFDLNTNSCSVEKVIKRLNRATGYMYSECIQLEGYVLELAVDDPTEICQASRPYGVTLLDPQQKQSWTPYQIFNGGSNAVSEQETKSHNAQSKEDVDPDTGHAWPFRAITRLATRMKGRRGEEHSGRRFSQYTVQIHYDAKNIGPRTVLEYYEKLVPTQNLRLAPPAAHPSLSVGAKQTKRACMVFLVTLVFTSPILVFAWGPLDHKRLLYAHISLGLASVVQIIACWEFIPGAIRSLIHSRLFEMDLLVALSTTAAYVFSVVSYAFRLKKQPLQTDSVFETSSLLVTLILLGRLVSEAARLRAAQSVSFRSLQVQDAFLVVPGGPINAPETRKIDARLLQYGDRFKVAPHTRIVTDGIVKYGGSEVDESMITGESLPVAKGNDSPVYAGTNNGRGILIAEVTALPHDNSISKIAAMVENAELTKPKAQALADRIAGWFVPAIAAIGIVVFLAWLMIDHSYNSASWREAAVKATTYAIATLIISCPCAIGLAVPMVILIAGSVSARVGIVFRDPQKLEIARNVTDVVFDKTGTLTTGHFRMCKSEIHNGPVDEVVRMLLGLLNGIQHPVSVAVYEWAKKQTSEDDSAPVRPIDMSDIISHPGEGIVGSCKGGKVEVRVGNPTWLSVDVGDLESGHTLLCMTVSGILRATFRLQDRPRDAAKSVVERLEERNIQIHMISGDNESATNATAFTLGISKACTIHGMKPDGKQEYVQRLQQDGKIVMFVGDGTNDAVALKQADVGVHLNHGSDVAKSAADIVLMNPQLHDILTLLDISKAAYRRIMLNFAWSALYNVLAILMAAGAFVRFRIKPAYAGLGELVSVLPVVLIALHMKWRKYDGEYRKKQWIASKDVPS